jgi:hypothetical protein
MQEISLEVKIQTAMAAQSVGEIKQQLKELKTAMLQAGEGSAEFDKLAMAAGDLQERMSQANDAIKNFNPDTIDAVGNFAQKAAAGVSLATGAMGLFGEQSKETEKALLKVQSAMAFTQGIQGIKGLGQSIENLFTKIAANPIATFAIAITALGVAMYKVWSTQQDLNSELAIATREYEKQKEVTATLSREYDRQIALLSAQGASTEEIIVVKRKLIEAQIAEAETSLKVNEAKLKEIESNDNLWESLLKVADVVNGTNQAEAAIAQNKKERSAEAIAQIKEQQESLKDLRNQLVILDVEEKKAAEDSKKTNAGSNADKAQKRTEDRMSHAEYVRLKHEKEEEAHIAELKREKEAADERERRRIEDLQNHKAYIEAKRKKEYDAYVAKKKQDLQEKKDREELNKATLDATAQLFGAAAQLSKKNAKLQKGFAVAEATVNTYKAVSVALSSAPPPANFILAAANLAAGLANIRSILSTNEEGGGAAPSGSFGSGASGSLEMGSPNVNASQQPSTLINEQGQVVNQQPQRPMYVSVTEIRQTGDYVQAQEERSRF